MYLRLRSVKMTAMKGQFTPDATADANNKSMITV